MQVDCKHLKAQEGKENAISARQACLIVTREVHKEDSYETYKKLLVQVDSQAR